MNFKEFTKRYGDDTTTNFQLMKWAKELGIKPFYYCMRDEVHNLKGKKSFFAICNIHTQNQKGVHHSALCRINGKAYFFDSFGLNPTKEIEKAVGKMTWSTSQIQKVGERCCGQLSLYVLYKLADGCQSFEDIILNLI